MADKKKFKISIGHEELVALENYQNLRVRVDISEVETNGENCDRDFEDLRNKVFEQVELERSRALDRDNFHTIEKRLINKLDNIIALFNEERILDQKEKRNIKKTYNESVASFKNLKELQSKLPEKKEKIKALAEHIKYVEGVIRDEFK